MVLTILYVLIALIFLLFLFYKRLKRKLISVIIPASPIKASNFLQHKISILTYNIAGLPQRISSAKTLRSSSIAEIGAKIEPFDIVNVQEDFNYNTAFYSDNQHPFRTDTKGKIPYGDGLNTVSKYPIIEYHRIPWRNCSGSDCWTVKGFSYARIQVASQVIIDVYNVHANAGHSARASKARRENLRQLGSYILQHSADRPLIVMGDFNAHYTFKKDNLHEFILTTGLTDGWIAFLQKGIFPEVNPTFAPMDMLSLSNETESLDKIFYRNSKNVNFTVLDYQVEIERFKNATEQALSDHLAVSMELEWVWKDD